MLYGADHSLMKQLDERALSALTNIRQDTFQGRKAGYNQLLDARTRASFLGEGIDNLIAGELSFLPSLEGSARKHRLLGDLAPELRARIVEACVEEETALLRSGRAALLPGADAPTIMPLAGNDDLVALQAVCTENVLIFTDKKCIFYNIGFC